MTPQATRRSSSHPRLHRRLHLLLLATLHTQIIIRDRHRLSKRDAKKAAGGRGISLTIIAYNLLSKHQLHWLRNMIPVRVPPPKQEPTRALSPMTRKTNARMVTQLRPQIRMVVTLRLIQISRHASVINQMILKLLATRIHLKLLLLLPTTAQTPDQWLQGQVATPTAIQFHNRKLFPRIPVQSQVRI